MAQIKLTPTEDDWDAMPARSSRAQRFAAKVAAANEEEDPQATAEPKAAVTAETPAPAQLSEPVPAETLMAEPPKAEKPAEAQPKPKTSPAKEKAKPKTAPKAQKPDAVNADSGTARHRTSVRLSYTATSALELHRRTDARGYAEVIHDAIAAHLDADYLEKGRISAEIKQAIAANAPVEEVQKLVERLGIRERAQRDRNANGSVPRHSMSYQFYTSDIEALKFAADANGTNPSVELERCLEAYLKKEWPMAKALAGCMG